LPRRFAPRNDQIDQTDQIDRRDGIDGTDWIDWIDRIDPMPEALMPFYICEHCAYETQDPKKRICERCKSELLMKCPYCGKPVVKAGTIYCGHCSEKLKISICPIQ